MGKGKSKGLLDQIEEEQDQAAEEEAEIKPADFDPIKKVATIVQEEDKGQPMEQLEGLSIDKSLLIHYFVNHYSNGDHGLVEQDPDGIQKLIIRDVAEELDHRAGDYLDLKRELKDLTLIISSKIYSNFFDRVSPILYSGDEEGIQIQPEENKPLEETIERYQDPLFRYESINPLFLMAGVAFVSYIQSPECIERMRFVDNSKDLKYLKLVDIYLGIIKNDQYKKDIIGFLQDTSKSLKNIATYSTMILHKDFFRFISKDHT